jgi:MFS transporter, PAT family, beta-lactamase induction signal transducer AmpG
MFLNLPFGATSGFVSVMLGSLLREQGMNDVAIASIVALNLLPHTWKFAWAPIADSTLTRKRWYVLANLASCITILALAFIPVNVSNVGMIEVLVVVNSLAITFVGMSVEGLMSHATPPEQRGRAAGWFQAGNLGGSGIGGWLGLTIATHVSTQAAFVVIAGVLGACTLVLPLVPEAPRLLEAGAGSARAAANGLRVGLQRLVEVFREVLQMVANRRGIVAVTLCFLPIGSAAASGIFAGDTAKVWGADNDLVAWTTGLWGGVVSALGCFVGGLMSDRVGRRLAYGLAGVLMAVIAVGMGLAPKSPTMFAVFSLTYSFGGGVAYGTFTSFVLEVIGTGAAATKYNTLASLSNFPIWYMTQVDGWASTEYGPANMLFVDAGSEIAGIAIFLLVLMIVRPGKERVPDGESLPISKVVE